VASASGQRSCRAQLEFHRDTPRAARTPRSPRKLPSSVACSLGVLS
jgi:hypothetical protein